MAGWPDLHDYNDAIQYPDLCFDDPVLKRGTLALNGLLPRVASGNFATVYQLDCGAKTYAVKCFHQPCHPDQANRYARISDYLRRNPLNTFAHFEFLERGIRVGGQQFPILKMEWVEGDLLDQYVEKNHANSHAMRSLAEQFGGLMADLKRLNIAHGDLQHGNVLVHKGQIKLIDYDGMFIPDFKGLKSYEVGHRNYQHPDRRPSDFDANLDHFAAWVIYLSLMALSAAPHLWNKVKNAGADCLLFHQRDFVQPNGSQTLKLIENSTDGALRSMVLEFREFIHSPLSSIPPLPHVNGSGPSMSAASAVQVGLGWLKDHFPRREAQPPIDDHFPPRSVVAQASVTPDEMWWLDHVDQSASSDFAFSVSLLDSEASIYWQVWDDTPLVLRYLVMSLRGFFKQRYAKYHVVRQKHNLQGERDTFVAELREIEQRLVVKQKERAAVIRELQLDHKRVEAKIEELKAQIGATPALEREEIAAATTADRERHLKSHALKTGAIAGFGAVRIQVLNDMGILTAADINPSNEKRVKQALSVVHRALPAREWRTLKRWRDDVEAAYSPPQAIVRRVREIERKYDDLRSSIRQSINARQVELGIFAKRIGGNDRRLQDIEGDLARLWSAKADLQHQIEDVERELEHYRAITFDHFLKLMRQRLPNQPVIPRVVSAFPVMLVGILSLIYLTSFILSDSQADEATVPSATSNVEWSPLTEEIDGVEMVLVPRGCFFYGSTDGAENGSGRFAKCINEPFWMDRYEVANEAFGSSGAWPVETNPYESVTWSGAHEYCVQRGGRLPTEMEWEFAARGPDSWAFVWGNDILTENVVYGQNIGNRPLSVNELGEDVSWVGAVGLHGNVAEWTSTIFRDYPYDETDGREDQTDLNIPRVVRGGSFRDAWSDMDTTQRREQSPFDASNDIGFRCVIPFES